MKSLSFLMGLALAGLLAAAPALADSYTFTTITVPGAFQTHARGVNEAGEIVGTFNTSSTNDPGDAHGFIDLNGTFTTLNAPGFSGTAVGGVNNAGQIVGYDASNQDRSFLYTNGAYTAITAPNPPNIETAAYGINNLGQITGNVSQVFNLAGHPPIGFLDTGGSFSYFGAFGTTFPQAINDHGEVVGFSYVNPEFVGVDGFIYTNGVASLLDFPGVFGTEAFGVNNLGQVVGTYFGSPFSPNSEGNGFLEENSVFTTINYPGALATELVGINDAGDIVGDYSDSTGEHSFLATPITAPEPMSLALVITGLVSVGVARRNRPRQRFVH